MLQRAPNVVESARLIGKFRRAPTLYSTGRRKLVPCLRHECSVASRGDRDMHQQHLHFKTSDHARRLWEPRGGRTPRKGPRFRSTNMFLYVSAFAPILAARSLALPQHGSRSCPQAQRDTPDTR